jgi:hypothetical protein
MSAYSFAKQKTIRVRVFGFHFAYGKMKTAIEGELGHTNAIRVNTIKAPQSGAFIVFTLNKKTESQ